MARRLSISSVPFVIKALSPPSSIPFTSSSMSFHSCEITTEGIGLEVRLKKAEAAVA
jgi:hypothetical protein